MKRITRILSILSTLLLMLLMAVNCYHEDEPAPTASITLSIPSTGPISQTTGGNAAASFEAGGGTASLAFSTNVAWTATSSDSWCTISPASGEAGNASITLTVKKKRNVR